MPKPSSSQKATGSGEKRSPRVLVLHGPNLNLLGTREPELYGRTTLADIHAAMEARGRAAGVQIESYQSNHEGELIDRVQAARVEGIEFIIINPGAYTHTSIALRDALAAVAIPFIELHLTNVHAREEFRRRSYFSDIAVGVICGLGAQGYELALDAALARLRRQS
ncbi:MAG TPA: type II 3-dehydroquinate dehydratase [Rhodocyclaceae bacterium]